jgi:hypothetical protein
MKPRRYANISMRPAVLRPTATAPAAKSSARKSISRRSPNPAMRSRPFWRARNRPWKRSRLHLRRRPRRPRRLSTSPVHPGHRLPSFPSAHRAWSRRSRSRCALRSLPLRCPSLRLRPCRRLPHQLQRLPHRPRQLHRLRLLSRPRRLPRRRKVSRPRLRWLPSPLLCRLRLSAPRP